MFTLLIIIYLPAVYYKFRSLTLYGAAYIEIPFNIEKGNRNAEDYDENKFSSELMRSSTVNSTEIVFTKCFSD